MKKNVLYYGVSITLVVLGAEERALDPGGSGQWTLVVLNTGIGVMDHGGSGCWRRGDGPGQGKWKGNVL